MLKFLIDQIGDEYVYSAEVILVTLNVDSSFTILRFSGVISVCLALPDNEKSWCDHRYTTLYGEPHKFNQCPSSLSFTKYLIYIWSASWQDNVVYIVFCQFKAVHSTLRFSMNFQLLVRPVYIAVLTTQKSCL